MGKPKVLVIGSTGMLGSAVVERLVNAGIDVYQASRSLGTKFDAEHDSCDNLLASAGLASGDYIVNCVGLTKAQIRAAEVTTVERAVRLNVLFPIALSRAAEKIGVPVIQVATDCVFSGAQGAYSESSKHDAQDTYGKSKSMGEVNSDNFMHLRCSLIGPEFAGRNSLFFEWVRKLDKGAVVEGYVNHRWNGLTSSAFGSIVAGIVKSGSFAPGVQHLVPEDSVTKSELIQMELDFLSRHDVKVVDAFSPVSVDRTLTTEKSHHNELLFKLGGYDRIPSIREMMGQLPWTELRNG